MPIVVEGTALVAPKRAGDCACTFCGLFRAHHYWARALLWSAVVPLLLWMTSRVATHMSEERVQGVNSVVGALLLISASAAVLAVCTWYQPIRRLMHIVRPRDVRQAQAASNHTPG